ncbi:MAG: hypothetical protein ACJAVV_001119 [Alphaproteobacteria bacterium]|jgi:hypothetical protein
MEAPIHSMESLFEQLGLDGSSEAVTNFIQKNAPIPNTVKLHEADFWTESQSLCLEEMIDVDADWAEIVDQLSLLLR